MRTPKEVVDGWRAMPPNPKLTDADFDKLLVEEIAKVQQDAWGQGMRDAAYIVSQTRMRFPLAGIEIMEAQKAIWDALTKGKA